ncbi:MAG TPA: hypothetical protein VEG62_07470 [Acidimicrobiales bacterium]|nr:hypothetical protein [Acidimicrobiales bacterium]
MSSLWTPSGEHFPTKEGDAAVPPPTGAGGPAAPPSEEAASAEAQAAVDAMREQLASAPAEVVVANHCYGLFELAAIYLSQSPPMLFQACLAIDGLGALLQGLEGRLGEAEPSLRESLSQLRLAYVRLEGAERAAAEQAAAQAAAPPQDGDMGTTDRAS